MGLGAFDESHPLSLGMPGMHGAYAANRALQECDLLLAVGARFDDRVTGNVATFAPHARIVHVDVDPTSIGKNVRADIPLVGDARDALERLSSRLLPADRQEWLERIDGWRRRYPFRWASHGRIRPQEVIAALGRISRHEAIAATGVGQHQMWAA